MFAPMISFPDITYVVRQHLEICQLRFSTNNKYIRFFASKPQMNPKNHVLTLAALLHLCRAVIIKGKLAAMVNPTICLTRPHSRKMQQLNLASCTF